LSSISSCGGARRIFGRAAQPSILADTIVIPPEILRAPPQDWGHDVAIPNSCSTLTFASIIT
jgi:hypothetical protein